MKIEDYIKLLKKHDWTYEFSDCPKTWAAGEAERSHLVWLAREGGYDFKVEFNKEYAIQFHRPPWEPPYYPPFPDAL
jgi:hypothetical protein